MTNISTVLSIQLLIKEDKNKIKQKGEREQCATTKTSKKEVEP